jgi:hypothetical protein
MEYIIPQEDTTFQLIIVYTQRHCVIQTVNFNEKLYDFCGAIFDTLQSYLYSWHNHPEDGHMSGRNMLVIV